MPPVDRARKRGSDDAEAGLRLKITSRIARHVSLTVALLACLAGSSVASAGCVWSDLIQPQARVAVAKPASARLNFVEDEDLKPGCPATAPKCALRSYVVRGDVVLTGPTQGGYTCAGFQGMRGAATIGWLPSAALSLLPAASQTPADWAGHWVAAEQEIVIESGADGILTVDGKATWGEREARRRPSASVHTGTLNGKARPVGGILAFTEGDGRTLGYAEGEAFSCRARLWRRGPYLVVLDNNNCGGANVSFSGFYARK